MLSWLYKYLARPVLFTQDPELVHCVTVKGLEWISRSSLLCGAIRGICGSPGLPVSLFGLDFPNPLGLAAGMDKNGVALRAWDSMGFGFSEIGAVTLYPQQGNPAPRVFRAIPEQAIVNRMGFNNAGAKALVETLTRCKDRGDWPRHPVGINLGKSKITPLEDAPQDYARSFTALRELGDFFVVNVSCPNQANLRKLQDKDPLKAILHQLQEANHKGNKAVRPILVKISPELSDEALDDILSLVPKLEIAGMIATNTTVTRPATTHPKVKKIYAEQGGLSGKPLKQRSTEVIEFLYRRTEGRLPIIGVGGIFTAEDAWEKITRGASLLQIFTGFVYEGPLAARQINQGLERLMKTHGFQRLQDAVGSAVDLKK